jgi:hypothetical protein
VFCSIEDSLPAGIRIGETHFFIHVKDDNAQERWLLSVSCGQSALAMIRPLWWRLSPGSQSIG